VSMRPGSQSLEHAATNVKEELGNSATDLAKVIAAANVAGNSVVDSSAESFVRSKVSIASESDMGKKYFYRSESLGRWLIRSLSIYFFSDWRVRSRFFVFRFFPALSSRETIMYRNDV